MTSRSSVAFGFLALILLGAVALSSPIANPAGTWGRFGDALFTACSAVCVTGLSVVDIGKAYTREGQIILMCLVQLGCLGLMTFGTFLLVAIGRRLSLSREFSLMNAYGVAEIKGLKGLIVWVVGSMAVVESLGVAVLYRRLGNLYESVFYSVMGFCNAGFSLRPDSLSSFAADPFVITTLACETILGGIGFLVLFNLCTFKFRRRLSGGRGRLSLHSSVVLRMTLVLLALGLGAFLAIEWNASLASFGVWKKLYVGFFQSVTPRTCGFSVIPTEGLQPLTRLVYEIMMFIGGGPGSAAAGIKVTTLAVLFATIAAMWRGDSETIISRRVVPSDVIRESIVIVTAMIAIIGIVTGALFATEASRGISTDALFFEAVSAVTTTGLSLGDTTVRLSTAGRVIIMCAMFIGRLGALSVVMMIGDRESKSHIRFPTEELVVG